MTRFPFLSALALALVLAPACGRADDAGSVQTFGTVRQGAPVEREFTLHNGGAEPLRIAGVQISPPMQLAKMPAVIAPGADAALKVTLDTSVLKGDYDGRLMVALAGETAPREYALRGKVVPAIEALPLPAVFLSTSKGVEKSASIELVSHEDAPIELTLASVAHSVYRAKLEPVEPGRRFRLTVTVPADAPAGRVGERIELRAKGASVATVPIGVNVTVRNRVYAFPDAVDFGSLVAEALADANPAALSQTVMAYQTGGRGFSVEASTDIPGVGVKVEPGPAGDRAQVTLTLDRSREPGPISGRLVLRTNDPEFPELVVPVSGTISE